MASNTTDCTNSIEIFRIDRRKLSPIFISFNVESGLFGNSLEMYRLSFSFNFVFTPTYFIGEKRLFLLTLIILFYYVTKAHF